MLVCIVDDEESVDHVVNAHLHQWEDVHGVDGLFNTPDQLHHTPHYTRTHLRFSHARTVENL